MWANSRDLEICLFSSCWLTTKVSTAQASLNCLSRTLILLHQSTQYLSTDNPRLPRDARINSNAAVSFESGVMAHPLLNPGERVNGERRLVKTTVDKWAEVLLVDGRVRSQNTKRTGRQRMNAKDNRREPVGNPALDTRYGNTDCRSTTCVASRGEF